MRIFPILTALLVAGVLLAFVLQRDALRALVGDGDAAGAAETAAAATPVADAQTDTEAAEDVQALIGPVSVVAERIAAREVESGVVLRGTTEAARRVNVRAETTGQVISDPLPRGAEVAAGDLLCRIDPGTRPAQLAEAEARLREAVANERATSNLVERGFAAETTAIANQAALEAAEAAIDQAQWELSRLDIRAPIGGLLEERTAELGTLLQPGSDCATIIDLDPIKLVGFAPEGAVELLSVGAQVEARLGGGRTAEGRVTFVARSADPDTRTFRIEAEAPNPDHAIRDGVTVEIRVTLDGTMAHLVPQSALTLDDTGTLGVRTVAGDAARFMPVTVIRDTAAGVWLTGLPDPAEVIVVGQDFVTDDRQISVTYRETGQ